MASQTFVRIRRRFPLRLVRIVTGRTRHARRRLKALALLQQRHLIPMYVPTRQRIRLQADMRSQLLARLERKRRRQILADASMALRASLNLSIAFEWRMAIAAFVALLHDIVITIGVYALTGFQVSPTTVIGLLTILGY